MKTTAIKRLTVLLMCMLLLTSCAAYPIEKSAHPVAIGIDYSAQTGLFTESGLYYLFKGDESTYTVLETSGYTISEASAKKSGYSYEIVNYSLLGAIALGEGALRNGISEALYPFLEWSLPAGDILLCAAQEARGIMEDHGLPMLLESASGANLLPRTSLADCLIALYNNTPLVLPYVTDSSGLYMDGAVILEGGVITGMLSQYETTLWSLLFYSESEGAVTSGGVSVQCKNHRSIDVKSKTVIVNMGARLISPGSIEDFRAALQEDLSMLVHSFTGDVLLLAPTLNCDYSDITVEVKIIAG